MSQPIHKLFPDLLLEIGALNANMFEDKHALRTTTVVSQVCNSWCETILEAHSIWAKLIDLDVLCRNYSLSHFTELLRRAGDSLLWIKCNDYYFEAT